MRNVGRRVQCGRPRRRRGKLPAQRDSADERLEELPRWRVYRADVLGIAASGARWLLALLLGGLGQHNPVSLFDNAPLAKLIADRLDLTGIARAIDSGALQALAITASGYTSGQSITFFQSGGAADTWRRARRLGTPAVIGIDHLMASAAMPLIFPAVRIDNDYYGDGSMRQIARSAPRCISAPIACW